MRPPAAGEGGGKKAEEGKKTVRDFSRATIWSRRDGGGGGRSKTGKKKSQEKQ